MTYLDLSRPKLSFPPSFSLRCSMFRPHSASFIRIRHSNSSFNSGERPAGDRALFPTFRVLCPWRRIPVAPWRGHVSRITDHTSRTCPAVAPGRRRTCPAVAPGRRRTCPAVTLGQRWTTFQAHFPQCFRPQNSCHPQNNQSFHPFSS